MFDLLHSHLAAHLGCVSGKQALALTFGASGVCVATTVFGFITRAHRLLGTYYRAGDWPGREHCAGTGPGTLCGVCGHPLAAHDRATGRCCHGTPMELLAVCIALPLPRSVRATVQQSGCPCRLRPWGS